MLSQKLPKVITEVTKSYHQVITSLSQNYCFVTTQLSPSDHIVKIYHKVPKSSQKFPQSTQKLPQVTKKFPQGTIELLHCYHKITILLSLSYHLVIIW